MQNHLINPFCSHLYSMLAVYETVQIASSFIPLILLLIFAFSGLMTKLTPHWRQGV